MTNQEILEKAIQKAIDRGWHTEAMDFYDYDEDGEIVLTYYSQTLDPLLFIYNHDFAKALWGKKKRDFVSDELIDAGNEDCWYYCEPWKYHLMHMVIADDPIKYLGENI